MSLEDKVFSHYRILQRIGRGGMGEVYLLEDTRVKRQVAGKFLRTDAMQEDMDSALRLFWREATAIAKLEHPAILPLYDHGEDLIDGDTYPYLVMPYCPEGSLVGWQRACIQSRPNKYLTLSEVAHLVQQASSGLQYAHDQQIMHLDVKPPNFLVRIRAGSGDLPDLLLSDFGIARLVGVTSHQSQQVRGTPIYMAPEQWAGKSTYASDQYALGIMTYELLCGSPPFQGDPLSVMYAHLHASPDHLYLHRPEITQKVDQVVQQALAKKPEERFASVGDFARAFREAVAIRREIRPSKVATSGMFAPTLSPSNPAPVPPVSPAPRSVTAPPLPPTVPAKASLPPLTQPAPSLQTEQPLRRSPLPRKGPFIGSRLLTCTRHTHTIEEVSWSPDGSRLASVDGTVCIWDTSTGEFLFSYTGHTSRVQAASWSPDGSRLASGSYDKSVCVWDACNGGQMLFSHTKHNYTVSDVRWSPDGSRLASVDHAVRVWDARSGRSLCTYKGHPGIVFAVSWSPDGSRLASGSTDKTVQVWDAHTGRHLFTCIGHSDSVRDVRWSPDSSRLASASFDKTVRIWDARTGQPLFTYTGHHGRVETARWSPDGARIASGSRDKTVQVWQAG